MWKQLLSLALFADSVMGQLKVCKHSDYMYGPSIDGLCPAGYSVVTNRVCCDNRFILTIPCRDATGVYGEQYCRMSADSCGKKVYPGFLEIDLCPKTCSFCRDAPTSCTDLRKADPWSGSPAEFCTAADRQKCTSADAKTKAYMKEMCPKLCGYCK